MIYFKHLIKVGFQERLKTVLWLETLNFFLQMNFISLCFKFIESHKLFLPPGLGPLLVENLVTIPTEYLSQLLLALLQVHVYMYGIQLILIVVLIVT